MRPHVLPPARRVPCRRARAFIPTPCGHRYIVSRVITWEYRAESFAVAELYSGDSVRETLLLSHQLHRHEHKSCYEPSRSTQCSG